MGRETLALTSDVFLCGTLRHAPLLAVVLGRTVAAQAAELADHAVVWAGDAVWPVLVARPGARAAGIVLAGLAPEDLARLSLYASAMGKRADLCKIRRADGAGQAARVFLAPAGAAAGADWRLEDWVKRHGAAFVATARDMMALQGNGPDAAVAARFAGMLARGASRVRAADTAPTELRRLARAGDIAVAALRQPYAKFFAMEERDLRFRRFDGAMSPSVNRAVFIACDAVTVLPYDPVRDRVLVIEQFRAGPLARGDGQPWQIEAIAGRIDAGESPEAAARREAEEEAGLRLAALLPVARYYPSPGCSAEFLYSFVALTDLPDSAAGVFGVAGEAEDIRGHLIGFARMMALIDSGEIGNAPTILTAHWLARHRERLRGQGLHGA